MAGKKCPAFPYLICLPVWCSECYWACPWINGMDFILTVFNLDLVEDYLTCNVNPFSNGLERLYEHWESGYDKSPGTCFDRIWKGMNSLLFVCQLPRLLYFQIFQTPSSRNFKNPGKVYFTIVTDHWDNPLWFQNVDCSAFGFNNSKGNNIEFQQQLKTDFTSVPVNQTF